MSGIESLRDYKHYIILIIISHIIQLVTSFALNILTVKKLESLILEFYHSSIKIMPIWF